MKFKIKHSSVAIIFALTVPLFLIHIFGASIAAAYASTAVLILIITSDHLNVIEKKLDNKQDKK
jgi:hypothetical protein